MVSLHIVGLGGLLFFLAIAKLLLLIPSLADVLGNQEQLQKNITQIVHMDIQGLLQVKELIL